MDSSDMSSGMGGELLALVSAIVKQFEVKEAAMKRAFEACIKQGQDPQKMFEIENGGVDGITTSLVSRESSTHNNKLIKEGEKFGVVASLSGANGRVSVSASESLFDLAQNHGLASLVGAVEGVVVPVVGDEAVLVENVKEEQVVASSVVMPEGVQRRKSVGAMQFGSHGDVVSSDTSGSEATDAIAGLSWSDEMSEQSDLLSGAAVVPKEKGKRNVVATKYDGATDVVGRFVSGNANDAGFFSQHVRVPRVRAFCDVLQSKLKVKIPKAAWEEMALAMHSTATVPSGFKDGQARLKRLSVVGDAAMTSMLIDDYYARGETVASVQYLKTTVLSNSNMSRSFAASGLGRHVVMPNGVDAGLSKSGADAVEAIAGVIHLWRDRAALRQYMVWMQFLA